MTKTEVAKWAAALVVGGTTTKVVKEIIQNNTDPTTIADKSAVIVGSYVLGAIVADASKKWTDAKLDSLIIWWTKNITEKF